MIPAKQCWHKSLVPLMESIKEKIGTERPVYITFDIDAIDQAVCPGTGRKIYTLILLCFLLHVHLILLCFST